MAYYYDANAERQQVISRIRLFNFVDGAFQTRTKWNLLMGKNGLPVSNQSSQKLGLNTLVMKFHRRSFTDVHNFKIVNPNYTKKTAQLDFNFNFAGAKWLTGMKRNGCQKWCLLMGIRVGCSLQ